MSHLYNPPIEKPGQFSRYVYSDTEPDIRKNDRPLSPQSDIETRKAYKQVQKGGEIPYVGLRFPVPPKKDHAGYVIVPGNEPRQRHSVSGTGRSPTGSWDRRRRDEETIRRKQEMQRVTAEEKRKRMELDMRANEARRHNDFLTEYIKDKLDDKYWLKLAGLDDETERAAQKSPIALNRYDDAPDVLSLQRPKKKTGTKFKGKARAIYHFTAQNTKEMSFRKNDVIYLTRVIDKNWYEGEHHGRVGIFPVNYVEVITSLDEARTAAILREGKARAKYNFIAQSGLEISFKKGDTVSLIRQIDDNWYEGRAGGKQGIFPAAYIEVTIEPETPLSSYAPTPATGSPSQLSPVSTISNGPAPTIPSAPISPRSSIDNFDFGQPYNFGQSSTLGRGQNQRGYESDFGLESLDTMRPASALGGRIDRYGSLSRDQYNPANRPSSAVPFTDYYGKNTTRDSGFYSSEDSKHSRQRQDDLLRSLSSAYEPMANLQKKQDDFLRSLSNPYETTKTKQQPVNKTPERISIKTDEPYYPRYRALYKYRPQNTDELELWEGDIVKVMEKCDDDWYVGTSERTNEFGTFPGNYVRLL